MKNLFKKVKKSLKIDDEDLSYENFDYLQWFRFQRVWNSKFCNKRRVYNQNITMDIGNIVNMLGVGAGAVACLSNTREYSQKSIEKYIENPLDLQRAFK